MYLQCTGSVHHPLPPVWTTDHLTVMVVRYPPQLHCFCSTPSVLDYRTKIPQYIKLVCLFTNIPLKNYTVMASSWPGVTSGLWVTQGLTLGYQAWTPSSNSGFPGNPSQPKMGHVQEKNFQIHTWQVVRQVCSSKVRTKHFHATSSSDHLLDTVFP